MLKRKAIYMTLILLLAFTAFMCEEDNQESACQYDIELDSGYNKIKPYPCNIEITTTSGVKKFRNFDPVFGNNPDETEYDYFFLEREGDPNKILINFMGGGACWAGTNCLDHPTNYVWDDIKDIPIALITTMLVGVVDDSNPDNPFKDWTLFFLPYTTGDIHWGSADTEYVDSEGNTKVVHHRGHENFLAVLRYIRDNYPPSTVEQVFVTGQSAGSYGAIFNFPYVKEVFSQSQADVLGDGGNGVLPDSFITESIHNWNVTKNLPDWIPGIDAATFESLSGGTFYKNVADYYLESYIGQYTTMFDHNQIFMYYVMLEIDNPDLWKDGGGNGYYVPDEIHCQWGDLMLAEKEISEAATNYNSYIAPGRVHTITTDDAMYNVEADGVNFVDWMEMIINHSDSWSSVMCKDCGSPETIESPSGLVCD